MKTVSKKLADLKPHSQNVRIHYDKQIKEFVRSLEMFGQIRPIVINQDNVILCGHGMYEAMLKMEWQNADCIVISGLSDTQQKKLMLADNKIYELGQLNLAIFDEILAELKVDKDFDIPGYDESVLQMIMADADNVAATVMNQGVVSQEDKDRFEARKDPYEPTGIGGVPVANHDSYRNDEDDGSSGSDGSEECAEERTAQTQRCVICHNCGERIWL